MTSSCNHTDYRSAIEFHLIAKENDKAREVAKEHDMVDSFALFLGNDGSRAEYTEIAKYYVAKKNLEKAAEFFEKSRDYREALELFLKVCCCFHLRMLVGARRIMRSSQRVLVCVRLWDKDTEQVTAGGREGSEQGHRCCGRGAP